jgi:hypothetical protein
LSTRDRCEAGERPGERAEPFGDLGASVSPRLEREESCWLRGLRELSPPAGSDGCTSLPPTVVDL